MSSGRFGRQTRLAEIGEAGQARLCAARVKPGAGGPARAIEERYLRGAGVALSDDGALHPADAGALGLRHPEAREVAEGAIRALAAISAILRGPA